MNFNFGLHVVCQPRVAAVGLLLVYVVTVVAALDVNVVLLHRSDQPEMERMSSAHHGPRVAQPAVHDLEHLLMFVGRHQLTSLLVVSLINVSCLTNKHDDLLQVRRDHGVDVLLLVETWHDADSVCLRRLHSDGYRFVDRLRPRLSFESQTLLTSNCLLYTSPSPRDS